MPTIFMIRVLPKAQLSQEHLSIYWVHFWQKREVHFIYNVVTDNMGIHMYVIIVFK